MIKSPSPIVEKIKKILMKRYAVEKVLRVRDIVKVCCCAFFSFLIFLGFWFYYFHMGDNRLLNFLVEAGSILLLALLWWKAWNIAGKVIPKFVLIGMLGWILITIGFIPNLFTGNANNNKNFPTPISRMISLETDTPNNAQGRINFEPKKYVDIFIAPGLIFKDQEKEKIGKADTALNLHSNYDYFLAFRYVLILMVVVFLIDLLLVVSTFRKRRLDIQYNCFYTISAKQREESVKIKSLILVTLLLILAIISLNYFILFWAFFFIAAVLLFRWEILERGKNHKPFSRAILFVILTQIFSSICGEILIILFLPFYSLPSHGGELYNLFHVVILGWTVILGSSVTVLIGIVTQVIWSGRRMTEKMKA